jgi:hypothetical protein
VAQILAALSAQREYQRRMLMTTLLGELSVQEELQVTPSQDEKILDLFDRVEEQRRQAFRLSTTLSEEERGEKFKEMAEANEKAVAAILAPAQVTRLKQMALQSRVPQAFSEPELAEALHLTAEQKARIRAVQEEALHALAEAARAGRGPAEADQRAREVRRSAAEKIVAELTPPQRAAWKELAGEPFRGRLRFASQVGLPPPDPGRPGDHGHGFPPEPGGGPGHGRRGPDGYGPPPPEPERGPPPGPDGERGPGRRGPGDGRGAGRPDRF